MKLKYIFAAIISLAFLAVGCTKEEATSLNNLKVSKTYLSIPEAGGDVTVTIEATEEWEFVKAFQSGAKNESGKTYNDLCFPKWLKASAEKGNAGTTEVKFTADETSGGREAELTITVGAFKQTIIVRQGEMTVTPASCADIIAGADGKTYRVTGTCTGIYNTSYGNWYLNDGHDEITIYGTLDAKGAEKNFGSLGIEVGDVVTVEGPKTTYTDNAGKVTIELVNVTVLKVTKALLKIETQEQALPKEGGDFEVKVSFKGDGPFVSIPEGNTCDFKYISTTVTKGVPSKTEPNPANTAVIKFNAAANTSFDVLNGSVKIKSGSSEATYKFTQNGNLPEKSTVAAALAAPTDKVSYCEGQVAAICNRGYILSDGTASILVYRSSGFVPADFHVGDKIKIAAKRSVYNYGGQFADDNIVYEKNDGAANFTQPTPVVYDAAKIAALKADLLTKNKSQDQITIEYAQVTGTVSVVTSGTRTNYNLAFDGTSDLTGSFYQMTSDQTTEVTGFNSKKVKVLGYVQSCSVSSNVPTYLNIIPISIEEIN